MDTTHQKPEDERAGCEAFLDKALIPLRIAVNDHSGFPLIVSLWFYFEDGQFWCATHCDSHLVKSLRSYPKVGFEVASNVPPYIGVRGSGVATLDAAAGLPVLERLLKRYHIKPESRLARWLLSRRDDEVAVCIRPTRMSRWDYRQRMEGSFTEEPALYR